MIQPKHNKDQRPIMECKCIIRNVNKLLSRAVRLHLLGLRIAFSSRMTYRADFFISSFIMLAGDLVIPLFTLLVYSSGSAFPGWNVYEVFLIQGVFMMSKGIAYTFFYGAIWKTLSSVREGSFDVILLKPHSALHMLMITSIGCDELGVLSGGIALAVIAVNNLTYAFSLHWGAFLLFYMLSLLVLVSFAILMSATVFKWVGNSRVYEIFDSITIFGQYPATIFSKAMINFLTWLIPVSMIAFIPASALLGKPFTGMYYTIPCVILFIVLSLVIWHYMCRKYASAGG